MRILPTSLTLLLAAVAATAQGPCLGERIDSPLLYLALDAEKPVGKTAPARPAPRAQGAVRRLLGDPALDRLLLAVDGAAAGVDSASATFALLKDLLVRTSGGMEMALTGILPIDRGAGRVNLPLLAFRAQLSADEATRMQGVLDDPARARRHRVVGATPTWSLAGRDADEAGAVEIAMVAGDLLVTNNRGAMDELLAPPSTSASRRVLAADERYLSLRERLGVVAGALVLYADWARLGPRLAMLDDALPPFLLEWSGLGGASTLMAALEPAEASAGFTGSVLLGFDARADIDGWFSAVQPVPGKALLTALPVGGLGGMVLAIDPERVVGGRGQGIRHLIEDALDDFGLDFDRQVLGRLGQHGTMQLTFAPTSGGAPRVQAAYAFRARSKRAAGELFDDLVRSSQVRGVGRLVAGKDRREPAMLQLDGRHDEHHGGGGPVMPVAPVFVSVLDDAVVFAYDAVAIAQAHEAARAAAGSRHRRDAAVSSALQSIGGERVAGVFDLDLSVLFQQLLAGTNLDGGGIPTRHTGYVDLQRNGDDVVVRLRVLSSR